MDMEKRAKSIICDAAFEAEEKLDGAFVDMHTADIIVAIEKEIDDEGRALLVQYYISTNGDTVANYLETEEITVLAFGNRADVIAEICEEHEMSGGLIELYLKGGFSPDYMEI